MIGSVTGGGEVKKMSESQTKAGNQKKSSMDKGCPPSHLPMCKGLLYNS